MSTTSTITSVSTTTSSSSSSSQQVTLSVDDLNRIIANAVASAMAAAQQQNVSLAQAVIGLGEKVVSAQNASASAADATVRAVSVKENYDIVKDATVALAKAIAEKFSKWSSSSQLKLSLLSSNLSFASIYALAQIVETNTLYFGASLENRRKILQNFAGDSKLQKMLEDLDVAAFGVGTGDDAFMCPISVVWHYITVHLQLGPFTYDSDAPAFVVKEHPTPLSFVNDVMAFRTIVDPYHTNFIELTAHLSKFLKTPTVDSNEGVKLRRIATADN